MAKALETIDGIARRLGLDVYYLARIDEAGGFRYIYTDVSEITDWLDARQIASRSRPPLTLPPCAALPA